MTTVSDFMYTHSQYKGIDHLFYYLPKITTVSESLHTSSSTETERVDLFTIFDWPSFLSRGGTFANIRSDSYGYGVFNFYKYINAEDYTTLCNLLLGSSITDIS